MAHEAEANSYARARPSFIAQRTRDLADFPVTSTPDKIERCLQELPKSLPQEGLGLEATTNHLLDTISPALAPGQAGPRCFGLVIGGVAPPALLADLLVTSFDPCVQVHWPKASASVALEELALRYVLALLSLPREFSQNTFTTGATASNILGLALGREFVVSRIKHEQGSKDWSVAEDGFGGVEVDVFIADAHASIKKAASLNGIGRRNVVEMGSKELEGKGYLVCFDLGELERRLEENMEKGRGSIVVGSFGEVNTGAINSDTPAIRELCDRYLAWLHIDAAFSAFAVLHPDYAPYTPHLALADSITVDAHKWLQAPYDAGLFFSRPRPFPSSAGSSAIASSPVSLIKVTGPGSTVAAYLASSFTPADTAYPKLEASKALPNPLFTNIENSRRFRSLPVLATLLSLGKAGFSSLVQRNIAFARRVDTFLRLHPSYDVLTPALLTSSISDDPFLFRVSNIVLFAPSSAAPARYREASEDNSDPAGTFLEAINGSNEIFCTPTVWRGRKAVRLAVSNWGTELVEGKEWEVVQRVLERVMEE